MKYCPVCGKKFTIFERLRNKDDEHYDKCLVQQSSQRINQEESQKRFFKESSFRSNIKQEPVKSWPKPNSRPPAPRQTQYVDQSYHHHHQSSGSNDLLLGAVAGYVLSSILHDDTPSHSVEREVEPIRSESHSYQSEERSFNSDSVMSGGGIGSVSSDSISSYCDSGSSSCDCGGGD